MAQPFEFPTLLAFLALDRGRDPAALAEGLSQDPAAAEALADELASSPLAQVQLKLAEPIAAAAGEAPLLAAGATVGVKHLRTLLKRQASTPATLLGPLCLEANDSLVGHLQGLVRERVQPALDAARTGGGLGSQLVSQLLPQSGYATLVETCLDEAVQALIARQAFVPLLLAMVSNPANRPTLEASVNAARVALAVLGEYRRFPSADERQEAFRELATAALLQDVSRMAEPDTPPEAHADRSHQLVLELNLGMAVAALVRDHHKTKTPSGEPVLYSKMTVGEPVRVLVVANSFLSLAGQCGKGGGFEAVKGLNHLAAAGYVDKGAVDVVSRLFLPKVKSLILTRASKIAAHCPQGPTAPVLWPVTGDLVPAVFICNREGCDAQSSQVSYVAQNIPFELDGEEITTIRKGNYFICPYLSDQLKELYQLFAQRNRSGGKA
jgi:hypothetical protein